MNLVRSRLPTVSPDVTASTNTAQGQGPLTFDINTIVTVANPGNVVTLPVAFSGRNITVINAAQMTVKVWAASGDYIFDEQNSFRMLPARTALSFQGVYVAAVGAVVWMPY